MISIPVNQGNCAVVGDWEAGYLRARWGVSPLGGGPRSLKPTKVNPQEPLPMNRPIDSAPLKQLPPCSVSLRMPYMEEVVFHTQSVESGCGLENLTTPLPEKLPSQSVFYQNQTETIPERVSERFIAGSPPSLLWSAPN